MITLIKNVVVQHIGKQWPPTLNTSESKEVYVPDQFQIRDTFWDEYGLNVKCQSYNISNFDQIGIQNPFPDRIEPPLKKSKTSKKKLSKEDKDEYLKEHTYKQQKRPYDLYDQVYPEHWTKHKKRPPR